MKTSHVVLTKDGEEVPDTPMRMLIQEFPDLAEKVFDKCTTRTPEGLLLDYQFLDDSFSLEKEVDVIAGRRNVAFQSFAPPDVRNPYHSRGEIVKNNHCLMLMVKGKKKQLLKHPLCLSLLRHKWKTFGQYIFYSTFIIYCLFLISITSYTLLQMTHESWTNGTEHIDGSPGGLIDTSTTAKAIFSLLVFLTVGLSAFIEATQILRVSFNRC